MRPALFSVQDILAPFYRHKVLTKQELLTQCGCSAMTAWRVLHLQGYTSSFNFNGRYYTLDELARFDEHGLWFYHRIGFSRYGTLPETIIQLIAQSPAGMTVAELEKRLTVTVAPRMSGLCKQGRVNRENVDGIWVYFDAEPGSFAQQSAHRKQARAERLARTKLPTPDQIIAVLVGRIQSPGLGINALANRLRKKGVAITPQAIERVFEHYELAKKKRPRC